MLRLPPALCASLVAPLLLVLRVALLVGLPVGRAAVVVCAARRPLRLLLRGRCCILRRRAALVVQRVEVVGGLRREGAKVGGRVGGAGGDAGARVGKLNAGLDALHHVVLPARAVRRLGGLLVHGGGGRGWRGGRGAERRRELVDCREDAVAELAVGDDSGRPGSRLAAVQAIELVGRLCVEVLE